MVEFDCVDCDRHIIALVLTEVPEPARCSTCEWLMEFIPDETEREELRARLTNI